MRPPATPPPVPDSSWRSVLATTALESAAVGAKRTLVLSAHPDDETIGAGRLIASLTGHTHAYTLTAGEACVDDEEFSPHLLARLRLSEWHEAVRILSANPETGRYWPDGTLQRHEPQVSEFLSELIDRHLQPDDTLIAPWRHDPHPDHAAAGRAAAAVVARHPGIWLVEYPVWAPYWMTPEHVHGTGFRLTPVITAATSGRARASALARYTSQLQPLKPEWEPVVPAELVERHRVQLLAMPAPRPNDA